MPQNWVLTLEIGWDAFTQVLDIPQITASLACRETEETEFWNQHCPSPLVLFWGTRTYMYLKFMLCILGDKFCLTKEHISASVVWLGVGLHQWSSMAKQQWVKQGHPVSGILFQSLYCPKSEFCSCKKRLLKLGWRDMKLSNEPHVLHIAYLSP